MERPFADVALAPISGADSPPLSVWHYNGGHHSPTSMTGNRCWPTPTQLSCQSIKLNRTTSSSLKLTRLAWVSPVSNRDQTMTLNWTDFFVDPKLWRSGLGRELV